MLIYVKFLCIFLFSNLVESLGLSLSQEEQIWLLHINLIGLNTVPLCFGFWAQDAWTYAHIEYRHPKHHPQFSHIAKFRLST